MKDKLEVLSGLRPRLITDVQKLPGARILDGQFTAVQQAIGTPKARATGAAFLRDVRGGREGLGLRGRGDLAQRLAGRLGRAARARSGGRAGGERAA